MTPELAGLLHECRDSLEGGPRLILADWLEDHGEPERPSSSGSNSPWPATGPNAPTCPPDPRPRRTPVGQGRLASPRLGGNLGKEGLVALASGPGPEALEALVLADYWRFDAEGLAALASLTEPVLERRGIGPDGAKALAGCPGLSHLQRLNLDDNLVTEEGALKLIRSPHLKRLADLRLRFNQVTPRGETPLWAWTRNEHVVSLRLTHTGGPEPMEGALGLLDD